MIDIPLQALANQELSIPLDGSRYEIVVKEANGAMVASITRDDVLLLDSGRIVADGLILPYRWQWFGFGNFLLSTQDEALPDFTQFGITQFMVYVDADEMAAAGLV